MKNYTDEFESLWEESHAQGVPSREALIRGLAWLRDKYMLTYNQSVRAMHLFNCGCRVADACARAAMGVSDDE